MDSLLYKELAETVHLIKARQTATLRHVVDEAMTAWRDSKGQHEVIHERATKDGTYQEVTKTWLAGNLAYLATVLKELEDIRKVWGAESPKQVHVEAEVQPVSPREQLTRIGQHMRQLMPEVVAEVVVRRDQEYLHLASLPAAGPGILKCWGGVHYLTSIQTRKYNAF